MGAHEAPRHHDHRLPGMKAEPIGTREIAMRSITWIRNYSLLVFFVVLVGGVLLRPANREFKPAASATPVVQAGFAP